LISAQNALKCFTNLNNNTQNSTIQSCQGSCLVVFIFKIPFKLNIII
jgi:hypothetical protein